MTPIDDYACEVCHAVPDMDGERQHGRGCYVVDADGGGTDRPIPDQSESASDGPTIDQIARAFGIPWPLAKAARDPFEYAVGLRTGEVLEFESCTFDEDHVWVSLNGIRNHTIRFRGDMGEDATGRGVYTPTSDRPMTFERGFVVRVVDIMWATDAPWGS